MGYPTVGRWDYRLCEVPASLVETAGSGR